MPRTSKTLFPTSCLSVHPCVRPCVRLSVCLSEDQLQFLQANRKMSLIKVVPYDLRLTLGSLALPNLECTRAAGTIQFTYNSYPVFLIISHFSKFLQNQSSSSFFLIKACILKKSRNFYIHIYPVFFKIIYELVFSIFFVIILHVVLFCDNSYIEK